MECWFEKQRSALSLPFHYSSNPSLHDKLGAISGELPQAFLSLGFIKPKNMRE